MNFDIKTEQLSGECYVISLAGEVDLYTAPEFKQQLLEVIGQGGKEVVVDFSNTTFINSTTLGVLVGGVKRLRSNDGQLSLVCSDRNITKIFEITGLDRVFTIYPTRDDAVSKLGTTGSNPPAQLVAALSRSHRRRAAACRLRDGRQGVVERRPDERPEALPAELRGLPCARRRRLAGDGRAEPRRRVPRRQAAEVQGVDDPERRPPPDPAAVAADAREPRQRPERAGRRRLRRRGGRHGQVERGQQHLVARHRRQEDLLRGVLQLPHAQGGERDRHRRAESRPTEAVAGDR